MLTALGAARRARSARARTRCSAAARCTRRSISGGEELSSYPARCVLGLERRTLPGETGRRRRGASSPRCSTLPRGRPELEAEQRTLLVREPFEVAAGRARSSAVVRDAAAARSAAAPPIGGASYWADAAFIAAAGIPTVMFGPGGEGAHAAEEWVSLADTEAVARTLVAVAERVCA